MSACVDGVALWMRSGRLRLGAAGAEVLWCASGRRRRRISQVPVRIGGDFVAPAASVRDLGICLGSGASVGAQVSRTVSTCFAALRRIRGVRRSVPRPVLLSLATSLVLSRLDFGGSTLAGLPRHLLDRLQSVLNATARLIFSARKFDRHFCEIFTGYACQSVSSTGSLCS